MDDDAAIRALIGGHFEGMRWDDATAPDWEAFRDDFLPEAQLFPAARPVQVRTVEGFIERMETVARRNLASFEEHTTGMQILRWGNVAVVLAGSEMLENGAEINRDVSGYLLVRTGGAWRIAAHAWDQETPETPLPPELKG